MQVPVSFSGRQGVVLEYSVDALWTLVGSSDQRRPRSGRTLLMAGQASDRNTPFSSRAPNGAGVEEDTPRNQPKARRAGLSASFSPKYGETAYFFLRVVAITTATMIPMTKRRLFCIESFDTKTEELH